MSTDTLTGGVDTLGGEYSEHLYRNDVVAQAVPDLAAIDADAIEEYRAMGFLAVDHALTAEETASAIVGLKTVIDEASDRIDLQFEAAVADQLESLTPDEKADSIRRLMKFVNEDERLHSIAYHPEILRVAREIIGTDDIIMFQDMALLKPPGVGREKPWHQDKAFFNIDLNATVVGVWIALDEATFENGCMHVLPGSHSEGPVPHFARRDWQICDTDVALARDVAVPLKPGGLLFFDGLIHHGTPANRTDTRRRAIQFHYVDRNVFTIPEEDRLEVYGLEGRGVTC
ncbi:phytanoyl-CoA dioxygenase family protein [Agromyces allii]|uniref:Phytanoyl-CoA dioxygenase family protein n=1 Tax=Agromyces allii TaxID=393607 RepID=A0ABN2QMI9_9MICO|nr:phytanoyl-CoA dioxygenase family protein [Agromyces allii]